MAVRRRPEMSRAFPRTRLPAGRWAGRRARQPQRFRPMNPSARILIVEDESLIADDLEHRLKKLGYEPVGIAASGEDGVARALELQPDLVLMDIRLKGQFDGIEAAGQ